MLALPVEVLCEQLAKVCATPLVFLSPRERGEERDSVSNKYEPTASSVENVAWIVPVVGQARSHVS